VPEAEYDETLAKAQGFLEALGLPQGRSAGVSPASDGEGSDRLVLGQSFASSPLEAGEDARAPGRIDSAGP
jgi:hypothetical protein